MKPDLVWSAKLTRSSQVYINLESISSSVKLFSPDENAVNALLKSESEFFNLSKASLKLGSCCISKFLFIWLTLKANSISLADLAELIRSLTEVLKVLLDAKADLTESRLLSIIFKVVGESVKALLIRFILFSNSLISALSLDFWYIPDVGSNLLNVIACDVEFLEYKSLFLTLMLSLLNPK